MLPIFSGMVRNSCWMSMLLMSRSNSSVGMLSNRMKHSPTCLCERPNISDTFTLNASSASGMLRCSSDSLLKQNKGKLDWHFEHFRHKQISIYLQCEFFVVRRRVVLGLGPRFRHCDARKFVPRNQVELYVRITRSLEIKRQFNVFRSDHLDFQGVIPEGTPHRQHTPIRFVEPILCMQASQIVLVDKVTCAATVQVQLFLDCEQSFTEYFIVLKILQLGKVRLSNYCIKIF